MEQHKRFIQRVTKATELWSDTQSNPFKTYELVNRGEYFKISISDYELWEEELANKKWLVLEIGVENKQLISFCIPSDNAFVFKELDYVNASLVKVIPFQDNFPLLGNDPFIDIYSGTKGETVKLMLLDSFRWNMLNRNWIEQQIQDTEQGLFCRFLIHFKEIKKAFEDGHNEIYVTLGLSNMYNCLLQDKDDLKEYCPKSPETICPIYELRDTDIKDIYCDVVQSRYYATMLLWAVKDNSTTPIGRKIINDGDDFEVFNAVEPCPPFCPDGGPREMIKD